MADQSSSSTGRRRRFSKVDYSFGENYRYRSEVPFASFEERLQRSRRLFPNTVPIIRDKTHRFPNNEAATGYRCLSLRGFVVQGSLDPKDRSLDKAFRIIDSVGWAYTVMHVHPFCPRVVREFISNKPFDDEGVLTRGHVFQFSSSTGGECSGWTGFNLNALLKPFQALYRVCELNWLPGPETDLMIKNRLCLLYAVAERKPISFGHLVYDQVIEMTRLTDSDTNLVFPNVIYQLLVLQHEVPLLPGDEEAIGRGLPIHGFAEDTSGRRGRRRIN
ncbi:hypothetical protein Bca101_077192 [Brassica carinata]